MIRCTRCLYPNTRPDTHFVDGVCSGCRSFDDRQGIDWSSRQAALVDLLAEARARGAPYDAVVPVSGGKDSTYQVLKLKELGGRVLAVNGATDMLSGIGRRNLDNLKRFADVIEWTPNVEVRKKLVRLGLFRVGDMSWPEHCAIWAIPTRIAATFDIPLVVWGEQPQREYSSPEGIEPATNLDGAWVSQFGGMLGMRLDDLIGEDGLTAADLEPFRFPVAHVLMKAAALGIWLGDYLEWDGWRNALVAQQYGFEVSPHPVETSLANYENLDNHVTVLRDWLRFLKYGYGRATDIACNHIRRGRLTREEGLAMVAAAERFPRSSLGKPIAEVLAYFGLTVEQYVAECDRWTNPDLFQRIGQTIVKDADGTPKLVAWAGRAQAA
ncbi:MAG: N-acetyl sugar amidotransferase [Hyphomicrobiales bacterium]|nr:N-acetyl sugar amidotransferase [Hyphomicrobiales bacterium]